MVYENIILTKKRINSKKWDRSEKHYSLEPVELETTPKQMLVVYQWLNTDSIEDVERLNEEVQYIVMSALGANNQVKKLDYLEIKADADAVTRRCSVTGKKVVIAHSK